MNKSIRSLVLLSFAALGAFAMVGCGGGGGGGGGGGSSSDGGSGGDETGGGTTDFVAPDNTTWIGDTLVFTLSGGNVLQFVPTATNTDVLVEANSGRSFQLFYFSDKFGGDTTSKTGNFEVNEAGVTEADQYAIDVIWTSTTEGNFTGTFYTDRFDPGTGTTITGTIQIL